MILRFGRDRFDYVQIITPSVNASLGVLKVTKSPTFLDMGSKPKSLTSCLKLIDFDHTILG